MKAPARLLFLACCCVATQARAGAAPACSSDPFTVDGAMLTVEVCAPAQAPAAGKVTLIERFTVKGQAPLERALVVEVLPRAGTSRSIDDVPLAKLGIARTLHLTVVYKPPSTGSGQALLTGPGQPPSAALEHAMLIPGAIALK
jgi:hypothetical protein